jgi:hypothetical protein
MTSILLIQNKMVLSLLLQVGYLLNTFTSTQIMYINVHANFQLYDIGPISSLLK